MREGLNRQPLRIPLPLLVVPPMPMPPTLLRCRPAEALPNLQQTQPVVLMVWHRPFRLPGPTRRRQRRCRLIAALQLRSRLTLRPMYRPLELLGPLVLKGQRITSRVPERTLAGRLVRMVKAARARTPSLANRVQPNTCCPS